MSMPKENEYVTHSYLSKRENEIFSYVNKKDGELKDLYHNLDKKFELDKQIGEQTIAQQKEMIQGIKDINDNFVTFDKRVTSLEDKTMDNAERINSIETSVSGRQKGSNELGVTVITTIGVIASAVFGAAKYLF